MGRAGVAAGLLLALASGGAHAATESNFSVKTTGDLVTLCDPKSDSALDSDGVNFCEGFAQGAVLLELEHQAVPHARQLFCLPDPPPSRDAARAGFVAWARAVPGRLDARPVDGLIAFLMDQYPCPKH